ncbi:MAG: archaemetzincin [Bacteroidetes bacterium]|nr:archaemetzincin [Bacteroidota bacterium]
MNLNIVPLKFSNDPLLRKLKERLSLYFESVNIFYTPVNIEPAYNQLRRQYHSTKILESIIKSNPESDGLFLVLTDMDLFVPVLTHVFGEAQLNGKFSIVSVCRLYEEFYTAESDPKLLLSRSIKEILHEIGHNFGLYHCKNWECVMHASNSVEDIDIKGSVYCEECSAILKAKNLPLPSVL